MIVAVIGFVAFGAGVRRFIHGNQSVHWPSTVATITQSYAAPYPENPKGFFQPIVMYVFRVDGHSYQGHQISFQNQVSKNKDQIESWIKRYPIGSQTRVFYKPSDPSTNVLLPGLTGLQEDSLMVIGLLLVLGAGIAYFSI